MSGVEIAKLVKIAYNSTPSKNTPCTALQATSRTSSSLQSEIDLSLSSFTFLFSD